MWNILFRPKRETSNNYLKTSQKKNKSMSNKKTQIFQTNSTNTDTLLTTVGNSLYRNQTSGNKCQLPLKAKQDQTKASILDLVSVLTIMVNFYQIIIINHPKLINITIKIRTNPPVTQQTIKGIMKDHMTTFKIWRRVRPVQELRFKSSLMNATSSRPLTMMISLHVLTGKTSVTTNLRKLVWTQFRICILLSKANFHICHIFILKLYLEWVFHHQEWIMR